MEKSLNYIFGILVALTLVGVFTSSLVLSKITVAIILLLSITKFLLVGYEFMEVKKAHRFWRIMLVIYCIIMGGILFSLL